jgi:membrane protein DedA with SNARE-associated domain
MFLNHFKVLILKIIFKKTKKNTLKSNHNHSQTGPKMLFVTRFLIYFKRYYPELNAFQIMFY